jgi:thioredoxin-related protein
VAAKLGASFVSVKMNPEKSSEAKELAKKFGTRGFPHIVFVDGTGNKVAEIGGYVPAEQFLQQLELLTSGK